MESHAKKLAVDLQKRSARALEIARKDMQQEHLQSEQVKDALELYMKDWCNIIHPGLISLAGEATDAASGAILRAQTAMLLLTAAFDIHDDIIDRSSVKNGKPTVFGKFGIDIALLVGNAFFVKGFTSLNSLEDFIPTERTKLIFLTAQEAFFTIGDAHALEIVTRNHKEISPDEYWKIVNMKSRALQADAKIGALLGGAAENDVEALATYGQAIGKLEILRDDFIDIFDPEELNNRVKNECPPLPILYAFQDKKIRNRVQGRIHGGMTQKEANSVVDSILESKEVCQLVGELRRIAMMATDALNTLPNSTAKQTMLELAQSMLEDLGE
jgi:geranylgeranyl diphosphate synthase type I